MVKTRKHSDKKSEIFPKNKSTKNNNNKDVIEEGTSENKHEARYDNKFLKKTA